ncbi:DegV family EDD domain-containing protein [Candidatus Bipolaricaulota bacterium]|nr:DegV family EDD domain-containing protein [Candidatus Bipolaricaulota bacterium]
MRVRVITDSDTGLQGELASKFGIDIVSHYLIHGDRSYSELDLPRQQMIDWLKRDEQVTSTHPTVHDYVSAFEEAGKSSDEVFYVPISSQYSNAYDVAHAVREGLARLRIAIVDSQRAAGGHALFALETARISQGNDPLDVLIQKVEGMHERVTEVMVLDSLGQLAREGRARNAEGAMKSLVSTKLLVANRGMATPIGKARTNAQALDAIVAQIKKDLARFDAGDIRMLIEYGTDEEFALRVKESLVERFSPRQVWVIPTSPAAMLRMGITGWSVSWSVVI